MLQPAPRDQVVLGDTTVTYLPDGEVHLEPTVLFPLSTPEGWTAYAPYLDPDGRLPVSVGSFLIRTPAHTVLVDLGLGAVEFEVTDVATFRGGDLLKSLAGEGLAPEDVDTVLFTHLHHDHVGWTSDVAPGAPMPSPTLSPAPRPLTFARASHWVAEAEWNHWRGRDELTGPHPHAVQEPLAPVIRYLTAGADVVPGVRAVSTPGHTPGHTSFLVTDPGAEHPLLVIGDVMHTQAQIGEPAWNFLFDADPALGTATRRALLAGHQDGRTIIAGGHFAGGVFGRLRTPEPRYGWLCGAS